METLRDLLVESAQLENQLVELAGELTPEMEEVLMLLEIKLPEKISRYMGLIDRLEMEGDNLYSKGQKYLMASKSLTGLKERLINNVRSQMIANGLKELRGNDEAFTLADKKGKLIIKDGATVPKEFYFEEISQKLDTAKLKGSIEAGAVIPGVSVQPTISRKIIKGK